MFDESLRAFDGVLRFPRFLIHAFCLLEIVESFFVLFEEEFRLSAVHESVERVGVVVKRQVARGYRVLGGTGVSQAMTEESGKGDDGRDIRISEGAGNDIGVWDRR